MTGNQGEASEKPAAKQSPSKATKKAAKKAPSKPRAKSVSKPRAAKKDEALLPVQESGLTSVAHDDLNPAFALKPE